MVGILEIKKYNSLDKQQVAKKVTNVTAFGMATSTYEFCRSGTFQFVYTKLVKV